MPIGRRMFYVFTKTPSMRKVVEDKVNVYGKPWFAGDVSRMVPGNKLELTSYYHCAHKCYHTDMEPGIWALKGSSWALGAK